MKTIIRLKYMFYVLGIGYFSLPQVCASEVEKFFNDTRADWGNNNTSIETNIENIDEKSQAKLNELKQVQQMVAEFEMPTTSLFDQKDRERNSRYYKYDKLGRLMSVEYATTTNRNEYYTYDKLGNITEKKIGDKVYKYTYDSANQLMELNSPDGKREYFYDRAGRLVLEKLNGDIDVTYKYGYLDKVTEVNRRGEITKYDYDGFGMLSQKTFADGSTEIWVWDGMTLLRRGDDIYINEPHASGGVPIASKTDKGVRFHEHDFLGTTLWSFDLEGKIVDDYQDTTVFGEGSIQHDRAARFTGKPYDKEMGAYIFPYRNYDPIIMRWRSADPSGYPDGINNQFYACVPTISIDPWGLERKFEYTYNHIESDGLLTCIASITAYYTGSDITKAQNGDYIYKLSLRVPNSQTQALSFKFRDSRFNEKSTLLTVHTQMTLTYKDANEGVYFMQGIVIDDSIDTYVKPVGSDGVGYMFTYER